MGSPRVAAQLWSVRTELVTDPSAVLARLAQAGVVAVEPVCTAALPEPMRQTLDGVTVDPSVLKPILDDLGMQVCSAHTALPEAHNANAVFDQQELLGNRTLVVTSLDAVPGARPSDLDALDTLKRTAERFNTAAALAAERGMRVGYHNHFWEWNAMIGGRPGYEVFWDHLDPSVVAEVDIYWARFAGQDPAQVLEKLGARAKLVHVKDGPLTPGDPAAPQTALGQGRVDIAAALAANDYVRWHIVELDACETNILDAVADSARWLVEQGRLLGSRILPLDATRPIQKPNQRTT